MIPDLNALTPWEQHGSNWVKRDDLFELAGIRGGKVRTCAYMGQGQAGLTTAGFRNSPQGIIIATVAEELGIPSRIHCPAAKDLGSELLAVETRGGELVAHRPGYGSVITHRAKADAAERGWTYIPFGMECEEAVLQTSGQAREIPPGINRLVACVGSGMSLAGILTGLWRNGYRDLPVVGVQVGATGAERRLDAYAPMWREMPVELVRSPYAYHQPYPHPWLGELRLDRVYEAKCLDFLWPGDGLWVIGRRLTD